jgi:RNA 2',3'-cyclic 3'-phosphodiesterase
MNKLFLALDLPSTARHLLGEYVPKVQAKLDRQGMRWVRSEKWHVTLVFIGDQEIETVQELVKDIIAKHQEPKLRLTKVGGFPDLKRPGTLWLGVEDQTNHLALLQKELAEVLGNGEDYVPHITLSRMKPASTKLGHKLRDFIHSGPVPEDIEFTAEKVTLFNSKPDGSYETVSEYPLSR